ncbi:MAG: TonB-dependent receptor [Melioribacteraceae bacterium]|nr:TonB-dependent receptor [Melioribacteraceae bacterium]
MKRFKFILFLITILLPLNLYAGTTGKIAGFVIDSSTGETLPFANIIIIGTNIGAASDVNGHFVMLNIAPGKYSVKVSMVGYSSQTIEDVIIRADLTTNLNFNLSDNSFLLGDIVVKAEVTLVIKDETSRTAIVDSKAFTELPIGSFQDMVGLQAGWTKGADGKIHARGGRAGEVVFLIDGVPDRNALTGNYTGQLDKYAIQEMQTITGGFNAEYGQALSGVVNIVTKDGGDSYHGRLEYQSDMLNSSPYHSTNAFAYDQYGIDENGDFIQRTNSEGTELINNYPSAYKEQKIDGTPSLVPDINMLGQISLVLGGPTPLIPRLKFFITGRYSNSLSPLPWGYDKSREFNLKLSYNISNSFKLSYYLHSDYRMYKPYSHSWKYLPDGFEDRKSNSWKDKISVNHIINPKLFYNASVSYNRDYYNRYTPGKFATFTHDGQLISSNYRRKNNNTPPFWTNADNGIYIENQVNNLMFKFDVTSQLGEFNLVKTGIQIQSFNIDRLRFQEPYPGGFHGYENYEKTPLEVSVYIQDKLEFNSFILNIGIRYDYTNLDDTKWISEKKPAGYIDSNGVWTPSGEIEAEPQHQISPRLGISFPITDKTVFYSSYGHFFQMPNYVDLYNLRDPTLDRAIIGNPGVEPQKTVAYEFGVKQQLGDFYTINLGVYYKDITNLLGSMYYAVFPYEYTIFNNSDYGQVKGFDINITKVSSNYWYANLNYSFSIAKGNESDPREGYNDYRRANAILRPKQVFPLDFDRRHVFNATLGLNFPENFGFPIGNFYLFENTDITFIYRAQTGLPYTPNPTEESEGLIVPKNSATMPSMNQLDFRYTRFFNLSSTTRFILFLSVQNLFDTINALNVWSTTGDPWDAGPTSSRTLDRQMNPTNVGPRRIVQVGVRLDF